jgi:tRNA (cytidine/uridine-2'-O-)-methyltransferase
MTDPLLNLVLFRPQIPNNTGNIGRTALATGSRLHLIHPLGFSLEEKACRRAGLDYWEHLDLVEHEDWNAYLAQAHPERLWLLSTKAERSMREASWARGDHLLFGAEDAGVPAEVHAFVQERWGAEHRLRIPMISDPAIRSLNLATAVAIAAYEALGSIESGF